MKRMHTGMFHEKSAPEQVKERLYNSMISMGIDIFNNNVRGTDQGILFAYKVLFRI